MRICIDARHLHGKMQGIDRYVLEVLNNLPTHNTSTRYLVLHNRDFPFAYLKNPGNLEFVCMKTRGCSLAQQVAVPLVVLKHRVEVYFYPYFDIPIVTFAKKNVCAVYDLNHFFFGRYAATRNLIAIIAAKIFIAAGALLYDDIMVISDYVRTQLAKAIPWSKKKLHVQYLGFSQDEFRRQHSDAPPTSALGSPYLLYVGNNRPHKNLPRLIKAFALVRAKGHDLFLVIAGNLNIRFGDIRQDARRLGVAESVILQESISDGGLSTLYRNASLFIYPSLSEGFGLPLLEAMYHEVPIAASDCSSIPEVAGSAAAYFDPEDIQNMAEVVHDLLVSPEKRALIVEEGKQRIGIFTWQTTVRALLQVLDP